MIRRAKKVVFGHFLEFGLCRLVRPLVRSKISWITALRIFLIFCMNVPYYKGKKRTQPFFQESCSSTNQLPHITKPDLN